MRRSLPPAAAPIGMADILGALRESSAGDAAVAGFERSLAKGLGVGACFGVSSGKAALVVILQALSELQPGRDEVLVPAYTCYSVPSAVVRAGFRVRLCDLAAGSLDFDFDRLEPLLANPRLLCVVATHLFGVPADVERVRAMARRHGVFVVEDAAQAMGGESAGSKLGTLGDVSLFSLGRGKAFSTVEGGVVLTSDGRIRQAVASRVASLPRYGSQDTARLAAYAAALSVLIDPRLYWLPKSLPFLGLGETVFDSTFPVRRLSPFQAGLGINWRKKLDAFIGARNRNAAALVARGIPAPTDGMKIPRMVRFPVLLKDAAAKAEVLRISEEQALGIADAYPATLDAVPEADCVTDGACDNARETCRRLVTLPIHPYVTERDCGRVADLITRKGLT